MLELRSRGSVTIDGILDVSANGTTPGPGGGAGGDCPGAGTCNGVDAPGSTGGEGQGGTAGTGGSGGGGSGGRFAVATLAGANGDNGFNAGTAGTGGAIPVSNYGPTSSFTTSVPGGVGGGAGGSGSDGTIDPGGDGGAGSGSVLIVAKDLIDISGTGIIRANGGAGQAGVAINTACGGGGGGGSGGAIYLVSASTITINGTVQALGGALGSGGSTGGDDGGDGSAGSVGRIRVDSNSGSYVGGATNPVANQNSTPSIIDPLVNNGSNLDYSSDIGFACDYREKLSEKESFLFLQILFGLVCGILLFSLKQLALKVLLRI